MSRRFNRANLARQLLMLLAIPIAFTGVGYALFSQQLSLSGVTAKPLYSSSLGLNMTYVKTETLQAGKTLYSLNPVTIVNRGTAAVTDWQLRFTAPTDISQLTCPTSVTCTQSAGVVTVKSGTYTSPAPSY